jgi:hypothetical protein
MVSGGSGNAVTLGTGSDTVSFTGGTNTVNAVIGTGATLNSTDKLTGGTSTDTLSLSGTGSFDMNSLVGFSAFEFVNLTGTGESLTLRNSQSVTVNAGSGNTVTLGTGSEAVSFTDGTNTINAKIGTGATLNSGDSLTGGTGTDTLSLSGTGSFDLNNLSKFTGFEEVDLTGSGQTLIVKDNLGSAQMLSLTLADTGAGTHGDTFVFHSASYANYSLTSFVWDNSGSVVHDTIRLSKSLLANTSETSSQWLTNSFGQTNVTDDGAGHAVIHDGNNTITLSVSVAFLQAHAADVVFV